MAGNLGSMLPSELRKFISEGHMGPKINFDSDPPPKVKAFIDKVIIEHPLDDLAIPLSEFHWEYNKGNFYHWRPLFLHFKTYFKTYLSSRKDLLLEDTLGDDTPFPKQSVLQILRVMQVILENCHNKSSFDGLEHFKLLLASTDPEVLIATLETLAALVRINPSNLLRANGKLVGCGSSINNRLLSLAQGWGTKKDGLSLYSSATKYNEKSKDDEGQPSDHIQTAENHVAFSLSLERTRENLQSMDVIHTVNLDMPKVDDLLLMKIIVKQCNIHPERRFSLLTRIRYTNAFCSSRTCEEYIKIFLLAFIVLVQASDSHKELVSFTADNEPEYTDELVRLVISEERIPRTIRTLAMHALSSKVAAYTSSDEREQIPSGSRISFADGDHTVFLNVLQKEILSLNNSSDPWSVAFVEALLQFYLLYVISTSITGSVIIQESGMVPAFLSLLGNSVASHMHLVCLAVKTLQNLMDYSDSDVTLFNNLGGVDILTNRLQIEVSRVINSSNTNLNVDSHKRLIRVLLKALGSAFANSTRPHGGHDDSLPATLSIIFKFVNKFGGDVYSAAVTVMSKMIHKDPTCYASLDESGLPNAFLASVKAGVLPSSKALTCVPNGIGAICLNPKGLEAVNKTSALGFLVDVLTDKKYVTGMNDGIVPLANAVEELLRHVSLLMGTGIDVIIEIVNKVASIEDDKGKTGKVNEGNAMDMVTEDKENVGPCLVGSTDSGSEGICDEQFIQLCIFHVIVLLHRTMVNAETRRLFVEKEGIEALLKLVLRPSITQSSEGMSIALNSTLIFESFTQDHSARLARAFCSTFKEYLESTLDCFGVRSGSFVLDPKATQHSGVFSSLFLVEFLLFLAASEDNRSVTALIQEFGNDSKDVLESIGKIHREILWQIALLEVSKSENEENNGGSGSGDGSLYSESNTSESKKQSFNSFRQCLNKLLRRQMSGWSFESQFFDLITHTSGVPQHFGGNSHQSLPSGTSDGASSDGPWKAEKKGSYYASCCDMIMSLSLHITHLFQELGRRVDTVMVSPAYKCVASTLAAITFDHMNFEGHVKPSGTVASWSLKCRYLGKVVDFIDGILLEKAGTCNPVLLNCLYGRDVIQLVLTTFEATSELLFTVYRTPASPMESDEGAPKPYSEETVWSWIHGTLASYGKLMDHLVTSSFILSPFTKHFLTQPLVSGGIAFPRDAEAFVKVLQSSILKVVLPVWKRPQFADCSDDFIATVISIICHVCSGVEVRSASNTESRSEAIITNLGYSQPIAEEASRQVGSNNVHSATEWLSPLPEDDELGNTVANESDQPMEEETMQLLPVDDLLSTCKKLLEMKDSLALPVRGLLSIICFQDDGRYQSNVISFVQEQLNGGKNNMLSSLFHVLPLMLNEDKDTLDVASKCGLVKVAADLLDDWNTRSPEDGTVLVPKWVTAAFLAVDQLAQVDQKLNADTSESLKKDEVGKQNSEISSKHIDVDEQKRLIEISCGFLGKLLPAETNHAILQLCSTLTRTYSVALSFLDAGGLPLLLSLRTSSLFVGTDNVAETIIRRTLRQTSTDGQVTLDRITKLPIANTKNAKAQRKPPERFTTVLELLLKSVIAFVPSSVLDIDILVNFSKGKGKAIATGSDVNEEIGQDSSASLAKVVSILKLLKEIIVRYSPSFHVLLHNDAEQSEIFQHLLCKFLLRSSKDEKKDEDWRHGLADRASQLLVASCVHSIEARTRILKKINKAFRDFIENCRGNRRPSSDIQAFVDLLGHVLAARSPTGGSISKEVLDTFKDLGLVKSITQTLEMLDLDHPDSQIIVTGLLKVLDLVTKELVHTQPSDQGQHGEIENTGDISRSTETVSLLNASSAPAGDMPGNEGDEDEDGDGDGHNDLEDDEVHHLPHHDTDQADEDNDGGLIFRLSEEMNGINMLDHRFNNDPLHVMPVEVFGSNRQRQTDNAREGHLRRLDSFFQSLRNGPDGQTQYYDMQFGSRNSRSIPTVDEPQGVNDAEAPVGQPQSVDTHFDQNGDVSLDVETVPVSQESSGSGATRARVKGVFDLVETNKWATYNISITATFPSEQQEKVLDILPSGLVKEGHSWVEWFACQHNPTLVESSRRGEGVGSSMDRAVIITARRSGSKPVETDGTSLVDKEDLKAMIGLLRVDQPESRTELQKLLLNLCAYDETRSSVVDILMDLLKLEMRKPDNDLNTSNYRLYDCQHDVTYARPQSCDGESGQDYAGVSIASNNFVCMLRVPPLISRRVLETLTYLASIYTFVAKLLLQFRLPPLDSQSQSQYRGNAIMDIQDEQEDLPAITILLSLLKHPLYLRSIAHLEQLLKLLDVIIDSTESKQPSDEHGVSVSGAANRDDDSHTILRNLPRAELCHLAGLLAHESLSDNAYTLVVKVLKKLVTITPHYCYVFIRELYYNMPPLIKSAMDELQRFSLSEKALTTASDGAAILRVIHALSSLVASLARGKDQTLAENDLKDTLSTVSDINSDLELLWTELRTCLSKIENYSGTSLDLTDSSVISLRPSGAMPLLPAGTHNIIPYIESFFVMCEILHPQNSSKPPVKADEIVKFLKKHWKLLNAFIRHNPRLLQKSFSVMLKFPRFIDFDIKRSHFRSKIKPQDDHHRSPLGISVRRAHIVEDSCSALIKMSAHDLKGILSVEFQEEEGIDAGGLTREWYQVLSRVIFDRGALLFTTVDDGATFQPNPNSVKQPEHLSYFNFVGRVVGKALFDGQLLDVHFTRSFYKHILGAKVTYHDMEAIDPRYFKSLKWMLENDITDTLYLTFSIDADEEKKILYEKSEVIELIPGGRNKPVTEENKHTYVDLFAKHRLTTSILPQIKAFLEGFNQLISRDLISIFDYKELELLISGLPDIDLDDMKANTEYTGYNAGSPVIQWFWEVAQGFSKEYMARLLQFVTGTSKVPLEGFSALQGRSGAQKFQIHKAYGGLDLLPTAHTCFNQLDLPEYPSKEHLEDKLLLAIHEANEGFGFG